MENKQERHEELVFINKVTSGSAKVIEQTIREKALKTLKILKEGEQFSKEVGFKMCSLKLRNGTWIYFDSFKVGYKNQVTVIFFIKGVESVKVVLRENEDLVSNECDILEIVCRGN
jgi:hypothetical protein